MDRLNLYLDLVPGELADLEVVAKASLAFANAVREIAYIVDPSLSIKLELESGTEGSLSLNSVIRFIEKQIPDPVTRKIIVVSVVLWFMKEVGAAVLGVGVSLILTNDPAITDQDAERIAERVQQLLERKVAKKPVQDVYRELNKDKSIKGVGVSTGKGDRPRSIVPREQFPERMEDPEEPADDQQTRSHTDRMVLTLISPVLQKNDNKWRFLSKDGIIYVGIKDDEFLSDLLTGRSNITMRSGIVILADVEIKEKKDAAKKVWVIAERNLIKAIRVKTSDDAGDLFAGQ
ncbi:hypothetical protein NKH48_06120 [Mesorhizobium sp. M1233]|uniref:hypothetical protein n=1 Tax=Mesorhizobium sp. M1233 TaxID=2957072 RepID=UPI00333A5618